MTSPETKRLIRRLVLSLVAAWAVSLAILFAFLIGVGALLDRWGGHHKPPTMAGIIQAIHPRTHAGTATTQPGAPQP